MLYHLYVPMSEYKKQHTLFGWDIKHLCFECVFQKEREEKSQVFDCWNKEDSHCNECGEICCSDCGKNFGSK
jgi:hypothetical protein